MLYQCHICRDIFEIKRVVNYCPFCGAGEPLVLKERKGFTSRISTHEPDWENYAREPPMMEDEQEPESEPS